MTNIFFPPTRRVFQRVLALDSDETKWRWLMLNYIAENKLFPGLISRGLKPLSVGEIVEKIYPPNLPIDQKLEKWGKEKAELLLLKLIDIAEVKGEEYIWLVDFHKRVRKRWDFFTIFLKIEDDNEKVLFLTLLQKFKPRGIDERIFLLNRYGKQFEDMANGRTPMMLGEKGLIKSILREITERVMKAQAEKCSRGKEVRDFMLFWSNKVKEKTGRPYVLGFNDVKVARELLRNFSMKELEELAGRFFQNPPGRVKVFGYKPAVFSYFLNSFFGDGGA